MSACYKCKHLLRALCVIVLYIVFHKTLLCSSVHGLGRFDASKMLLAGETFRLKSASVLYIRNPFCKAIHALIKFYKARKLVASFVSGRN